MCVCVFFLVLVAVLRWLPRCFTIGEAMVVTQSIALLSTDSFTDLGIKVLTRLIKIQKAYKPLLRCFFKLYIITNKLTWQYLHIHVRQNAVKSDHS